MGALDTGGARARLAPPFVRLGEKQLVLLVRRPRHHAPTPKPRPPRARSQTKRPRPRVPPSTRGTRRPRSSAPTRVAARRGRTFVVGLNRHLPWSTRGPRGHRPRIRPSVRPNRAQLPRGWGGSGRNEPSCGSRPLEGSPNAEHLVTAGRGGKIPRAAMDPARRLGFDHGSR